MVLPTSTLAIETRGLSKVFGGVPAVDGIDLAVPVGSTYGFLGPNGSGKTTTIRVLLGLLSPSAGSCALLGEAMPERGMATLPRGGALVEGPAFYPWLSGHDNLARIDAMGPDGQSSTREARIGDGFMFSGRTQTEAVQIKTRITARLRELGRDADAFGFESIQQYTRGDNQWPGDIAAWREAGGSHISVVTMGANLNTVDGHIEAIRRWRDVYNSVR